MEMHPLRSALEAVGCSRLAAELGISQQAVHKWLKLGRMPRTEWTGESNYSTRIEALTGSKVTRAQLLGKWPAPDAPAVPSEEQRDAA